MILASLFAQASLAASAGVVAHPALEAALWHLFQQGQASWPQIALPPELFALFLARQLPPEAARPEELAALRARDLYLVCALGCGDRLAQTIFHTEYMPRVRRALLQIGTSESEIADIQQNLYGRLLEKRDLAVVRWGYFGRGELGNWLCTCAVREAGQRHKRGQRELALEKASEELLGDLRPSPETAALSGHLRDVFSGAFKEALAALSSRERNLLRYHFLAELSIDQIGAIYHVHRATAARWVTRAQERLISKTRELFILRTEVSTESLPRVMEIIQSQLSMSLGKLLNRTTESDPPAGAAQ